MARGLIFFALVAAAVWGVVTLAETPGWVTLEWGGYRIDTSFAVLMGAVAVIAVVTALLYRFWGFLHRAPGRIAETWRARRRQQGYQALTRGMVAIASGDADEAKRQAKRAGSLLDEPPLTMLVSAQAAQMNGDEKAAARFFTAMTEKPETEFLGVRGLLTQALKRGDKDEALSLARRAYRLKPKSAWVASSMFELQISNRQWLDARVTCDDLERHKLIDGGESRRRKAVLAYLSGEDAARAGDGEKALDGFSQANKFAPGFVPAAARLARRFNGAGKAGRAAKVIEDAWATSPHPDLLEPYWRARDADAALDRVKAAQRLAERNPNHPESHIAIAGAALDARLWGEARDHLGAVLDAEAQPPARVCRLMAALEDGEFGDGAKARDWLVRASRAPGDAAWTCGRCGAKAAEWKAACARCDAFDSLEWQAPSGDGAAPGLPPAGAAPALALGGSEPA